MIIPIRCMTCGKVLADKWNKYQELVKNNPNLSKQPETINIRADKVEKTVEGKVMDELGLKRPVALFPFSVGTNRTIPNKILKGWIKDSDADYIVFGSANDTDSAEKLVDLCDEVSIRSVCGNYSLRESIALISTCKFTLATDSGLGHISAALGIPTISFFGVGKDTETGPKGEKCTILKYCSPCMGDSCKDQNKKRMCIKENSRSDIEYAVNSITNL